MTKKESIIIYARQKAAITRLSLEQKGVLLDALLTYADGEEPTFEDGMVAVAFDFFRSQIDADSQKWEDVRQKRVEAGKLGGRPKKTNQNQTENKPKEIEANESKQKQKNQMVLDESKRKQKNPVNVNDNVNVNVNVNDNVNDNNINIIDIKKTSKRKTFVPPTLEDVKQYIEAKGYTFSAEAFFAYYESNGWRVGRNPMKKWESACVTWQKRENEKRSQTITLKPNEQRSFYNSNQNIEDAQRRQLEEIAASLLG